MKAIEFIDWMIKHSVTTESILRTRIDEDFDCKAYCGYECELDFVTGEYAVIYSSSIDDAAFGELAEHAVLVYTDGVDRRDGISLECIMFIILT